MFKYIKRAFMGLGLTFAALAGAPEEASANDYCREYTRTVYIGNRAQEAYGQACLQPDGSWMIVGEGLGNDIPQNATNVDYVIRDNNRYITPPRVVYYPSPPRIVHRSSPSYVWYQGGHYRGNDHGSYRWDKHWERDDQRRYDNNRYDRHGRDDHRGNGRGHSGRDRH